MRRRFWLVADLAAPLVGAAWLSLRAARAIGRLDPNLGLPFVRLALRRDLAVDNPERVARGRALLGRLT